MAKSRDAFRTIGEVAAEMDLPPHVLRFWESKFTQIRPVKRAGGRRYYRPEDINLLAGIKALLHGEGMTIKGVQGVLREAGTASVMELGASVIANDGAAPPLGDERSQDREAAEEPPTSEPTPQNAEQMPAQEAPSVLPFPALASTPKPPARARKAPPEPAAPATDQLGLFDETLRAEPRALAFIARAQAGQIRNRATAYKPIITRLEALYDALCD